MAKTSCDFECDRIMVSKDIFIEEKYSLEENPLEESCDEEVIEVIPCALELVDLIIIKCPPKSIPTSIVLPPLSLLHSCMDPSMFTSPKSETCLIYTLNLV